MREAMERAAALTRAALWRTANALWLDDADRGRFVLIVSVGLALRIAWTLAAQTAPVSDAATYDGLGWRLAQGMGYAREDGAPTAFLPVGYPAFLAALYTVFGHSWTAAGIANALLGALSIALTYRLAREVLPSRASLAAAGAVALLPSHIIAFTPVLRNEALHLVFVLAALLAACAFARRPDWRSAALFGAVIGVGVYVRPILLFFPVAAALLLLLRGGGADATPRRAAALATLSLLVAVALLMPWTARNYAVFNEPILTATNGGITFYLGNGPGATGEYRPITDARFAGWSELDWHREGYRLGLERIANHPGEWLAILPRKVFFTWASDRYNIGPGVMHERWRAAVPFLQIVAQVYWTLLALAAAAAVLTRPLRGYWLRFPAALLLLTLAYWTAFHLMWHGEGRYHMQMVPLVAIAAAHLLTPGASLRAWLPRKQEE